MNIFNAWLATNITTTAAEAEAAQEFSLNNALPWLSTAASNALATWLPKIALAVGVFVLIRMLARVVVAVAQRALGRMAVEPTLSIFVQKATRGVFIAIAIVAALIALGVETTSLAAAVGAAGLAIGLALQGTLSNCAAGVMLLGSRPFQVGHFVEVGGAAGVVREVGLFSTTLDTTDNVRITVPNAQVYGQTLRNFAANTNRRIDLNIGVAYTDDLDLAKKTIMETLQQNACVLADPAPQVEVAELADSSVNFVVRPWCKGSDYWPTRFALIPAIKKSLEAAGCSIPFPQQDVHMHQAS